VPSWLNWKYVDAVSHDQVPTIASGDGAIADWAWQPTNAINTTVSTRNFSFIFLILLGF
jgi:hypothetical protein